MILEHMDASTLPDEIFISQHPYFEADHNKVCRFNKALYELKQAIRIWNIDQDS